MMTRPDLPQSLPRKQPHPSSLSRRLSLDGKGMFRLRTQRVITSHHLQGMQNQRMIQTLMFKTQPPRHTELARVPRLLLRSAANLARVHRPVPPVAQDPGLRGTRSLDRTATMRGSRRGEQRSVGRIITRWNVLDIQCPSMTRWTRGRWKRFLLQRFRRRRKA